MITRKPYSSILNALIRPSSSRFHICAPCKRLLHEDVAVPKVPQPTPFVPDVPTFLTLIGRELSKHQSKIKSWQDLFTLSSSQLKELGIEPPRARRYLLRWREKFRRGEFGIGGDFKHVHEGSGELRVIDIPSINKSSADSISSNAVSTLQNPGMTRLILNVPAGEKTYERGANTLDLKKPKGFSLKDGHIIVGSHIQPIKGTNGSAAKLKVKDGLWEDRRGHKVFGGERRRAETIHKLRLAERRNNTR